MTHDSVLRSLRAGSIAAVLLPLASLLSAQQRFAILSEPGTPVVATEVLIATGLADEQPSEAGLAYLSARAVVRPILPVLDSLGARLSARAQKDAISFTLVAAPDAWEEATRTLLVALFRDPVDSVSAVRERQAIHAELIGREANPADALARETDATLFGREHPWGRSEVGYARTVRQLSIADVDRFLRTKLIPGRTVVAVAGPVDPASATGHLLPFFQSAGFPMPQVPPGEPAELLVRKDYNSITTWISASYRFPPGADVAAIRVLADLVAQALSFGPTRRSIYDVQSEVRDRANGGEVQFQVVVPPSEAELWAERIRDAVAALAGRTLDDHAFEERLRRYRGRRLLQLNSPEARVQDAARTLLVTGRANSPAPEPLSAERLQAAARSLRSPVIVFLGPSADTNN